MATSITPIPSSPTMSAASSFDAVSSRSRSSTTSSGLTFDDSDDEIVWRQSDGSVDDDGPASDDDFVVLSRPRSPPAPRDGADTRNNIASHDVHEGISSIVRKKTAAKATKPRSRPMSQSQSPAACTTPVSTRPSSVATTRTASPSHKGGRRRRKTANKSQSPSPSPSSTRANQSPSPSPAPRLNPSVVLSGGVLLGVKSQSSSPSTSLSPAPKSPLPASLPASPSPKLPTLASSSSVSYSSNAVGLGARSIVDDISERASECGSEDEIIPGAYDAAASYITSCLSNPSSVCRLTLLQSLIVEFDLVSSSLPMSLGKAKAMLKSRVFVNISEYLDARQRGPAAVQEIIHPSRKSLLRDLRQKRSRVPRQLVKEAGLGVLLVSFYH
ncbi:hypothetical protein B0H12DRAFT_1089888 [Mycena haematopus]|nr:hypothetical protein B0H12DRAFT_1089888 [Mycena haematopus]